jgi:hypothetical protein
MENLVSATCCSDERDALSLEELHVRLEQISDAIRSIEELESIRRMPERRLTLAIARRAVREAA